MDKNEERESTIRNPSSFFMQTKEDVARAVAAAISSPRPSVIFSAKDDSSGSPLQRLQHQVTKVLKGFSSPHEEQSGTYNPEVLTIQKRQWAKFHLDHRSLKEPTRLFESMVVVGLHPNCDIETLKRQYIARKSEASGKLRTALTCHVQSRVAPNLEPQVLFVYPPEKKLPLKYKDLLSFCFPGGVEVNVVEKTPSMSELNAILLGQEHLKRSDLSFLFRLQVADDSTLYGCCVLVEELIQNPSGLLSIIPDNKPSCSSLSRQILTTRRCYCILSRLPFFELHFGVLNSILAEERLERLTEGIGALYLESPEIYSNGEILAENTDCGTLNDGVFEDMPNGTAEISQKVGDDGDQLDNQVLEPDVHHVNEDIKDDVVAPIDFETEIVSSKRESATANLDCQMNTSLAANKQGVERHFPNALLPLFRYYHYKSSEASSSVQSSPSGDWNFGSDIDDTETEETSFSGQEDSNDLAVILEWAKENNIGSLQIICEYYRLHCPARGSTLRFHPLEHLDPLEYHRSDKTALNLARPTIGLRSCGSVDFAEAQCAFMAEEEATALAIWTVASICGSLRLENILTMFAGALLEKQIVVICSDLGILSASVLSIIPLICPYQWQCLLAPVLPNDMLDFLDAPVPYIVGVKNKTSEVQSKSTNTIVVDANTNQVKAPAIPQLPKYRELFSSLSPYYAKLVGESYLGRKRPVYECTDVQVEAATGFLAVLRLYLDSLCSNLRSHTITNVQSNDDKVSLLLKESFIDSFARRDRPFMKHFVDTQLFSVHTDLVLSFIQKE